MTLKIFLLGQFRLQYDDLSIELPSRSAQSLLAYLVLNAGIAHRREKLASLFWPESNEADARGYLRQALWRVRKSFTDAKLKGDDYLQISELSISFDKASNYWLDADQLLKVVEGQPVEEVMARARLYIGEFLPGFYDEWIVLERDRMLTAYHRSMNLLIQALIQTRNWDAVLKWSEEWIYLGYSPEPAFKAMMQAYAGLGNQGMVSATYQRCVKALDRELGLQPSLEIQRLYEQILKGDIERPEEAPTLTAPQREPFLVRNELPPLDRPVFVARKRELSQLETFFEHAALGQGQTIFITGEAGSGKSALLAEFTRRILANHSDLIVASASCNAHTGAGDPYLPFREILGLLTGEVEARWRAGALDSEHAQQLWNILPITAQALVKKSPDLINTFIAGPALLERARSYSSANQDWFVRLEELVKIKAAVTTLPMPHQSDLLEQYTGLILALAHKYVLVLVIDDLQWADLGSISLLFHLARQITGSRVLIAGAYRPEEVALGREGLRHPLASVINECQRIFGVCLVDIDQAESRAFMDALIDSEPNCLGAPFRDRLFRQTLGNPLFTIELLRGMQERGDILQDTEGRWLEGPALDWETLPARVEAVIGERIGRLAYPLQAALRAASVEGDVFTAEVLERVWESGERGLLGILRDELDRQHRLICAQSIQRIDGQLLSRYRFRHTLYQQYLYQSLDEVERVHLHEQVGCTLEALYKDCQESPSFMDITPHLARHFQEAKIVTKAIHYLQMAGERALQLNAYQQAATHLEAGLKLISALPDSRERAQKELALLLAFGWTKMARSAPNPEAKAALTKARQLSHQTGSTAQLCLVLYNLSTHYYVRGEHLKALELAEEGLRTAQQSGDPFQLALSYWHIGFVQFAMGDYRAAHDHLGRTIAFYDPHQHHQLLISVHGMDAGLGAMAYDACCLWCLGYPEQAAHLSQEALTLARALRHAFSQADVVCYGGCMLDDMRGNGQSLLDHADELVTLSKEASFTGYLATGTSFRGQALAMSGQIQEGIEQIRQGMAMNASLDVTWGFIGNLRALAQIYASTGQVEKGLQTLDEAVALVEKHSERNWEAELYRLSGELLLMQGNEDEAEASLQKAVQVARQQHARSWELRSATSLAALWQKQGRTEQAHQLLSEVYAWFTEGFETPDLIKARELLSRLE
jgi:DNA-binding SARP family transcriptional activator/tetratricopeptide (TPR) repeat protein